MKDRYKQKFAQLKERKEKALIPFVVAGDPDYNTSLQIVKTIEALARAGLEITLLIPRRKNHIKTNIVNF